jgi:hypothetical protein
MFLFGPFSGSQVSQGKLRCFSSGRFRARTAVWAPDLVTWLWSVCGVVSGPGFGFSPKKVSRK